MLRWHLAKKRVGIQETQVTVSISCSLLLSFLIRKTGGDPAAHRCRGCESPWGNRWGGGGGRVLKTTGIYSLAVRRLESEIKVSPGFVLFESPEEGSPSFWWWLGVLGTPSLGDNVALISKPVVDGPFLSVSLFSHDLVRAPVIGRGARPNLVSPHLNLMISARTLFLNRAPYSQVLGVNTSTYVFGGHDSAP